MTLTLADFIYDSGGTPQQNWTVALKAASNLIPNLNSVLQTTTTDAYGRWAFTGLSPANYDVEAVSPSGADKLLWKGLAAVPQSFTDAHIASAAGIQVSKLATGTGFLKGNGSTQSYTPLAFADIPALMTAGQSAGDIDNATHSITPVAMSGSPSQMAVALTLKGGTGLVMFRGLVSAAANNVTYFGYTLDSVDQGLLGYVDSGADSTRRQFAGWSLISTPSGSHTFQPYWKVASNSTTVQIDAGRAFTVYEWGA